MIGDRASMGDGAARVVSLALLFVVCAFPLRGFLTLDQLPLAVRLAWFALAAGSLVRPFVSLLLFLVAFPLLPIVPERAGWPLVSLPELWLFALLLPAWLRIVAGRRSWRAGVPAAYPVLLAVVTASVVVAVYPFHVAQGGVDHLARNLLAYLSGDFVVTASQRHPHAPIVSWAVIVEGLAVWWLVATECAKDPARRARRALVALGAGAVLVAGYGLVQWYTGSHLLPFWVKQDPSIVRINATFTDVNGLGAYLAMMLWIVVAVMRIRPGAWWRWTWRFGAVAVVAAAIFTASRAAWGAMLAGGLLYASGLWRFHLSRPGSWWAREMGRVLAAGLVAGVLLIMALTAYATTRNVRYWDQRSYLDGVVYTFNLRLPPGERLKGRAVLWQAAVRMIASHPIEGIGIGRYYKEVYRFAARQDELPRPQENAHNYFLQVGAEIGLLGLGALLALAGSAVTAAFRVARTPAPLPVRRTSLAVAVSLLAFGVTWLTGHSMLLRSGQYVFWAIAACAVVMRAAWADPAPSSRSARLSLRAIVVGALVAAIAVSAPIRAGRAAGRLNVGELTYGLYDVEYDRDGRPQRWSGPSATIYLPASARAFRLPIRSLAPFPQRVRILLDGQLANEIQLVDHDWREIRYILPAGRAASSHRRLELQIEPPWQPPDDPRLLGVLVGPYRPE